MSDARLTELDKPKNDLTLDGSPKKKKWPLYAGAVLVADEGAHWRKKSL